MDIASEIKGEIRAFGTIRDKHGNIKGQIELRGEATQREFNSISEQVKNHGSDPVNSGP